MVGNDSPPLAHGAPPGSLGAIIGSFKAASARRSNQVRHTPGGAVWQRSYFEHIVRNERALQRIRAYILRNPEHWALDVENPLHRSG